MEKEGQYVLFAVFGFIILLILIFIFTRKKNPETNPIEMVSLIKKRLGYNKVLLYIVGTYRLLEVAYYFVNSGQREESFYSSLRLQAIISIPSMIIGLLALISSVVGIVLSFVYLKKESKISKKLLIVSTLLFTLVFLWKYIIGLLF